MNASLSKFSKRLLSWKQKIGNRPIRLNEDMLLEIDKVWSSASLPVAGLIHGKNVARSREEFLEKILELWPVIRENLNLHK